MDCGYRICQCHAKRSAPVAADTIVAADGLIIEGVASTPDPYLFEFAPGLKRLDGSTSATRILPSPLKFEAQLPMRLLWSHEADKPIGEVVAFNATAEALYFKAVVFPPATAGYDNDLLFRVWDDVRTGKAAAVSIAAPTELKGDRWTVDELSIVAEGRNPKAVITKITFPDGEVVTRPVAAEKSETPDEARSAPDTHREPMYFAGPWEAAKSYQRCDVAQADGTIWICQTSAATERPGTSAQWRLLVKTEMVSTRKAQRQLRSAVMTGTTGKPMTAAEVNARMSEIGSQLAKLPFGTHANVLVAEWDYLKNHYDRVLTTGTTL